MVRDHLYFTQEMYEQPTQEIKDKVLDLLKNLPKDIVLDKLKFEVIKKKNKICIPNMIFLASYRALIKEGKIESNENIFTLLRKQRARSISGISAITILTKAFGCPGKCVYCPTEDRMPKSYLSDEPAVMRAVLNKWDPKRQVACRLKALYAMGHPIDKCEMIILGGTFSAYPADYLRQYILDMYNELNKEESKDLLEAQQKNEIAEHRCVGLSIETRQDHIDIKEIKRLREFGVTKVELGVQNLYDDILDKIKRGHRVDATIAATKLLKDAGYKIHYHMMPNLPGATIERDIEMFKDLFNDQNFRPDMLKIYPCVVTVHSELKQWEEDGKYKCYGDDKVIDMLVEIKKLIPEYCRIMRLGRDIPANNILDGNQITNIREVVRDKMKVQKTECVCQRCREVGFRSEELKDIVLYRRDYDSSDGKEIYMEYRDSKTQILLAFLRFRITSYHFSGEKHFLPVLQDTAIIREVHTYGFALEIDKKNNSATQHKGYGKSLIAEAERIAIEEFKLNRIAVISGIGVRGYYKKLGYELEDTYMVKSI